MNLAIYLVDDILNVIYKDKAFKVELKGTLQYGNIINKEKFIEEFGKILKKEKIKSKLFGDKIVIVKNAFYTNRDIFFMESVFLEMGFVKVSFIDIEELLPERDATYIEINNEYMIIYLQKALFIVLDYISDIPLVIKYFKTYYKKDIVLFGINHFIPKINVHNLNIYYLENYNNLINDSLLKVKKYDA